MQVNRQPDLELELVLSHWVSPWDLTEVVRLQSKHLYTLSSHQPLNSLNATKMRSLRPNLLGTAYPNISGGLVFFAKFQKYSVSDSLALPDYKSGPPNLLDLGTPEPGQVDSDSVYGSLHGKIKPIQYSQNHGRKTRILNQFCWIQITFADERNHLFSPKILQTSFLMRCSLCHWHMPKINTKSLPLELTKGRLDLVIYFHEPLCFGSYFP